MSDQYMIKCLWKGVADTDQQQDAAARIQDLEARLEAMTQQHEAALGAVAKANEKVKALVEAVRNERDIYHRTVQEDHEAALAVEAALAALEVKG